MSSDSEGQRLFSKTTLYKLYAGRYNSRRGIFVGVVCAIAVAVIGVLIGSISLVISQFVPLFVLEPEELLTIWTVHATIVSLSLVGLSFAWNSIRSLPTTNSIISILTQELRSIDTISFLLSANILIGFCVLWAPEAGIPAIFACVVGTLLVTSFIWSIHRFQKVLDLLLHNSLNGVVSEIAENSHTSKYSFAELAYSEYIEHFLFRSKLAIEKDRSEELADLLEQIVDLVEGFLWESPSDEERTELMSDIIRRYWLLYRDALRGENTDLVKKIIASVNSLFWVSRNNDHIEGIHSILSFYPRLLQHGLQNSPKNTPIDLLFNRFDNLQSNIFAQFNGSSDEKTLSVTKGYLDGLRDAYAQLWRAAIEAESRNSVHHLHQLLIDSGDVRLTRGELHPEGRGTPIETVRNEKQKIADQYNDWRTHLLFASYGWLYHLYAEGDLSREFTSDVFDTYVINHFNSIYNLSDAYTQIEDGELELSQWEGWNLDRELKQSHGPVMSSMAVNGWLLRFYCAAAIWILDNDSAELTLEASQSPFLEKGTNKTRLDEIRQSIRSIRDGEQATLPGVSAKKVEAYCDLLLSYFSSVEDEMEEEKRREIRKLSISEEIKNQFERKINEQLESSAFRQAIKAVSPPQQGDIIEDDRGFTVYSTSAREVFVDTGTPIFFNSSFLGIIERYRRFVLDKLALDHVDASADELSDKIEEEILDREIDILILNSATYRSLRDDPRSERAKTDGLQSYYRFAGVPVLQDFTEVYDAVGFSSGQFEYVESDPQVPITINIEPGEEIDAWSEESFNGEEQMEDYARIEYNYQASITSKLTAGVVFNYHPEEKSSRE